MLKFGPKMLPPANCSNPVKKQQNWSTLFLRFTQKLLKSRKDNQLFFMSLTKYSGLLSSEAASVSCVVCNLQKKNKRKKFHPNDFKIYIFKVISFLKLFQLSLISYIKPKYQRKALGFCDFLIQCLAFYFTLKYSES